MKQVLTIMVSALLACNAAQAMQQYQLPMVGKITPLKVAGIVAASYGIYKLHGAWQILKKEHDKKRAVEAVQNSLWSATYSLWSAAFRGDKGGVESAIAMGANVNMPNKDWQTPLMLAVAGEVYTSYDQDADYKGVVLALLHAGATNEQGVNRCTCLKLATCNGAAGAVAAFEEFEKQKSAASQQRAAAEEVGGQPQMTKKEAQALLFTAASEGNSVDVEKALAAGADSNGLHPYFKVPPLSCALAGERSKEFDSLQPDYKNVTLLLLEADADYTWYDPLVQIGLARITWIQSAAMHNTRCAEGYTEFQRRKAAQEAVAM